MDSGDKPGVRPTRREVITTAGAAGVVAGIDALAGRSRAESGKVPHVVIVGAGLAGLCAAYRLQEKGWTYTILEADRKHVGGRVRTMPIGNGLHWEAGAMRIPGNHKISLYYVDKFKLDKRTFVMENDQAFYFARGHKERAKDKDKIKKAFDLTPMEVSEDLWKLTVTDRVNDTSGALSAQDKAELRSSDSFASPTLIELDRLSLRQLMQRARLAGAPLSDQAIEYLLFSSGNLTLQHGASTEFLREELENVWIPPFFEIVGGTSNLPKAFLSRLTVKAQMGCEVIRLEQDPSGHRATAIYRTGSAVARAEGDFLLCTIPFPVLARIEVDPPFSPEKQRAIVEIGYDSATKVVFLTKNRFWETNDGIYGGSSTTDLMTGPIFYPSDNAVERSQRVSNSPGVLLASYTWGQDARRLGAMTATQRQDFAFNQVRKVHPELGQPGMVLEKATWTWDSFPWAGGAFAFYQPGQFARIHRHVVAPEGRIHFAGEHCSHSHSWMQGALESAENAVEALLTSAG
jgi:monoamine oxidase